ncbi:hypothetical protein PPMP20_28020 [Paraburkholderia phymatum]|uniref:hypothetical protein n=1 Tax=Paraburkholderia phymatum TaxID=148447 RepID=UPI0012FE3E6F|nr:hypothetical protein [Paraburkholderia phymatum]
MFSVKQARERFECAEKSGKKHEETVTIGAKPAKIVNGRSGSIGVTHAHSTGVRKIVLSGERVGL